MEKILEVWTFNNGLKTVFCAAPKDDAINCIKGGYHEILRRADEKFGPFDAIHKDGKIIKWSARFC